MPLGLLGQGTPLIHAELVELPIVSGFVAAKPATPGCDLCGRVVSTTSPHFKPGQLVFGSLEKPCQYGSLAEYTLAPSAGLAPVPEGISPEQAGAVGIAGTTAYQCIAPNIEAIKRSKEQAAGPVKIFINGGSGGTGTYGIQIAKALGAHVTTSCSSANTQLCKDLGADEVIDYKAVDLSKELAKKGLVFDLVVDNVGVPADLYRASTRFLKPEGKYVQVGAPVSLGGMATMASRMMMPAFLGGGKRQFQFLSAKHVSKDFTSIGEMMKEGKVRTVVHKTFPLTQAAEAFAELKLGRVKGKIVVKVRDDDRS